MLRAIATGILTTLLISTASHGQATGGPLEVSPTGMGSAAILPIYTVRDGFDTLVSLYSAYSLGSATHAVRVRILDEQGNLQLSANVYISGRHGSSAFNMTRSGTGIPEVRFTADACVLLPDGPAQPNTPLPLDEDSGYIEFFVMGRVAVPVADPGDCEGVQQVWDDGEWSNDPDHWMQPPANGLKVSATLINVERATMYSVDATHLRNFSSVVQHTPPTSDLPNLSSAHAPSPDDAALTRSRNCFSEECIVDDWDAPLEAVRAALMASRLYGEYVTSPSINANTEWVLNYPTRHYMDVADDFLVGVSIMPRDGDGLGLVCSPEAFPGLGDIWCYWRFRLNHDAALNAVDIGFSTGHGPGSGLPPEHWPSAILRLDNKTLDPVDLPHGGIPTAGVAVVNFFTGEGGGVGVTLINPYSDRQYRGQPVIGLVLQEYSNAQLVDPDGNNLLARYGNVFDAGRVLRLWE